MFCIYCMEKRSAHIQEEKELRKKGITVENKIQQLDFDEEIALKQIDLMKNELVNIYRFKQSTGKDRFDLAPDNVGKLNDGKAYCCALLGYELSCMRRTNITGKKKKSTSNLADILPIRTAKRHSYFD